MHTIVCVFVWKHRPQKNGTFSSIQYNTNNQLIHNYSAIVNSNNSKTLIIDPVHHYYYATNSILCICLKLNAGSLSVKPVPISKALPPCLAPWVERLGDTTSATLGIMPRRAVAIACWVFPTISTGSPRCKASIAAKITVQNLNRHPIGRFQFYPFEKPTPAAAGAFQKA